MDGKVRFLQKSRLLLIINTILLGIGCNSNLENSTDFFDPQRPFGRFKDVDPGLMESAPGGSTTNPIPREGKAFEAAMPPMTAEQRGVFKAGFSLFKDNWNVPLSSTAIRDGLGPFFNAKSCRACHSGAGRSPVPSYNRDPKFEGKTQVDCNRLGGMLLRISIPRVDPRHPGRVLSQRDPIYWDQLEPNASGEMPLGGEATQCLIWRKMTKNDYGGQYVVDLKNEDGTTRRVELVRPEPLITNWNYGDPLTWTNTVYISPRIAPQIIGMGLLEAVPLEQLRALEDPDDRDGDGVSGRVVVIPKFTDVDGKVHENVAGRFGWKAEQPTVSSQTANAFWGDLGLTTPLHPTNQCPDKNFAPLFYDQCIKAAYPKLAGDPEVAKNAFEATVIYTASLAVPTRVKRSGDGGFFDKEVIEGWRLFRSIGCDKCHNPSFKTGPTKMSPITRKLDYLWDETIYPYTDLLIHDMGPGLCDNRPPFYVGAADGCEWRTPPLWGIGRIPEVNGHFQLLHDGRATGIEEAILWHGGEAQKQKERYTQLSETNRNKLISFVNSL